MKGITYGPIVHRTRGRGGANKTTIITPWDEKHRDYREMQKRQHCLRIDINIPQRYVIVMPCSWWTARESNTCYCPRESEESHNIYIPDSGIIILEKYLKAQKQYISTVQWFAQYQTFSHWHSNCLLSKITRGKQVDLSSNNKHISDAWQVMASSGNRKHLQFTVSNADSCCLKSLILPDMAASFSIKVLSKVKIPIFLMEDNFTEAPNCCYSQRYHHSQ